MERHTAALPFSLEPTHCPVTTFRQFYFGSKKTPSKIMLPLVSPTVLPRLPRLTCHTQIRKPALFPNILKSPHAISIPSTEQSSAFSSKDSITVSHDQSFCNLSQGVFLKLFNFNFFERQNKRKRKIPEKGREGGREGGSRREGEKGRELGRGRERETDKQGKYLSSSHSFPKRP